MRSHKYMYSRYLAREPSLQPKAQGQGQGARAKGRRPASRLQQHEACQRERLQVAASPKPKACQSEGSCFSLRI